MSIKRIKAKQFSQEFKNSVIERIRNGETQMGVAKSLGITCKTVNSWWTKAMQELPQEQLSAEQEIARLKKLLREREAEIDFLKKRRPTSPKCPKEVCLFKVLH